MDKSVARLNIEHYRKLLATDLDPTTRKTVQQLLAQEEATLARLTKRDQGASDRGNNDRSGDDQFGDDQSGNDQFGVDGSGNDPS